MQRSFYTIGYKGSVLEDFVATLRSAGVGTLIDVRDVPLSRKPGFSKSALAANLEANGIAYVHLKGLGDPKPGREAARAGKYDLFRRIFGRHMSTDLAQRDLERAAELVLEPSRLRLEPHQGRHYAELHETHRIVEEQIESSRDVPPVENTFENERDERSHRGRYADLGTTHRLVDVEFRQHNESTARQTLEVEQTIGGNSGRTTTDRIEPRSARSDSKREADDRTIVRQARMREFGRGIEEGFHDELDQDSGRDRGR